MWFADYWEEERDEGDLLCCHCKRYVYIESVYENDGDCPKCGCELIDYLEDENNE